MTKRSSQAIKRGTGLSIWLILIVIHGFGMIFVTLSAISQPEGVARDWLVVGFLIFSAAKAIAALGIWYWRKWGLYLYVVGVLGTMAIALFLTRFLIWGVFYEAIPLLITGWFLMGKQKYFS